MKKVLNLIIYIFLFFSFNVYAETGNSIVIDKAGEKQYYSTLSEAINSVTTTEQVTITLLEDVEIDAKLTISNKNIIINGNNYEITYAKKTETTWYTGQLFDIKAGASLTLKNTIINGNNNWVIDNELYQYDIDNLVKVETVGKYITPEENKPNITAVMINNAGELKFDNSTIKNFYSSSGKGLVTASASSITTYENTTITHCAEFNSSLVIYVTGANAKVNITGNTLIDDNYIAGNGGIFKIYNGAVLTMNGGKVTNTKGANSNGVVVMTYGSGSTFILNDGLIANNSGVIGKNNGRNAPIYMHNASNIIINGGTIENNYGNMCGGIDTNGSSTASITLNGGTIQNNKSSENYYDHSDIYLQNDYDLEIGKDVVINGHIYIKGDLINNGRINGDITLDLSTAVELKSLDGTGTLTGDLIIKHNGVTIPVVPEDINIIGKSVLYDTTSEVVVRFEYNGGEDETGYDYDLQPATKEGKVEVYPKPVKKGYKFINWYVDKELTIPWNEENITSNKTLYAAWELKEYTITWVIDKKIVTETYYYNDVIKLPTEPIKEGYVFTHWENYETGMTMPDKDLVITAVFEKMTNPNTGVASPYIIIIFVLMISVITLFLTKRKKYI